MNVTIREKTRSVSGWVQEVKVAFGIDVNPTGRRYWPGPWLVRNFLWNTRLADEEKRPRVYAVYKWLDDRIVARVKRRAEKRGGR